jgi:hypothetical protein
VPAWLRIAGVSLLVAGLLAAPPAGAATKQRKFVAWKDGKPTVRVTARRNFDCLDSSQVNYRADAWRCVGAFLYDPCFENLAEEKFGELLCVSSPWADSGILAFSALDYDNRYKRKHRPWAIVLTSGKRCRFVAGATGVSHGRRLNYVCGNGKSFLYGEPDRSKPTWRIFAGKTDGRNWHREKIRTAWH